VLLAASCGESDSSSDRAPDVVVTYSVLGSVVREVVGDAGEVTVLMPNGVDPHDWEPSARDIERISEADLAVTNGLDLEEGLEDALREIEDDGVPVFAATDHVELRTIGEGEVVDEHEAGAEDPHADEHGHGADDPHIWLDPLAMRAVAQALGDELARLGFDVADNVATTTDELYQLDAEIQAILAAVPDDRRKLVTGHDSLGYFADRYGFAVIGTIIPSVSSQAEASAGELAELKEHIEEEGVPAIFTEIGTPADVVDAIADETGVEVVELSSHNLPDDGRYTTFMLDNARVITQALAQ
jgi:zinc/manganese transport system substrate-binding protein